MPARLPVLMLDDGELDDVQRILQGLQVSFGRVRGSAIVQPTPAPSDLLIATPRRLDAVAQLPADDAKGRPMRVVVVNEDSFKLREKLREIGFDYLVRRPVHPEALRLLIVSCLYRGEERRTDPRVPVGLEVSFRAGLLTRRGTLADLSMRGCRLLSRTPLEPGKRIKVQIPEALEAGDPFSVSGRVLRVSYDEESAITGMYSVAVLFEETSEEAHQALEILIEDRANGPATLRSGAQREPDPIGEIALGAAKPQPAATARIPQRVGVNLPVDVKSEVDTSAAERRRGRRGQYERKVPAFGSTALRVLIGRDLSTGGMRIDATPDLQEGDRLHFALYGEADEEPFLVWGTIARNEGERGMGVAFDPLDPGVEQKLERLVSRLPAVESLRGSEADAMGTVVSKVLED